MSHPVISDPVIPRSRRGKAKGSSLSFLSFPVVLMIFCAIGGLPVVSSRLWALDSTVHAHNDAIVSVLMAIAPYFLVAFAALGIFMFIRAGQRVEVEPEV